MWRLEASDACHLPNELNREFVAEIEHMTQAGTLLHIRRTLLSMSKRCVQDTMTHTTPPFAHSTSIWLDLVRGLSAQLVLLGHLHLLDAVTVSPIGLPVIQTIAVIVFYILSGFLIMRSIRHHLRVPGYDFLSFFIDRFSRIYPAYFGTLCFVAIADWFYIAFFPEGYTEHGYRYRSVTFVSNIFLLEKINLRQGTFGSASQLWSLTPEWWLYMAAGYIAFSSRSPTFLFSKRSVVLLAVFLYAPVWFLFRGNPGSGTGIVAIWILGALAYLTFDHLSLREISRPQTRLLSVLGLVFFCSAGIRYRMTNDGYDLLAGFDLTAAFLCSVWLSQSQVFGYLRRPLVQRIARLSAFYSYSLYLTHYTIVMLCNEIGVPVLLIWTICNVFALGFAWVFEKRHKTLALALHRFRRNHSGM